MSIGNYYNWCNYIPNKEIYKIREKEICELWNNNYSSGEISNKLNISQSSVINTLKKLNEYGLCNYNPSESRKKYYSTHSKKIYVYDISMNFLNVYNNINDLKNDIFENYNIEIIKRLVYKVCNKEIKKHKGFIFSYEPLQMNE